VAVNRYSKKEIENIRYSGQIAAHALRLVEDNIRAGVSTQALDALAERFIEKSGAVPAFKGYHGFPATLCTSINEVVVHGFPSARKLKNADLIGVDVGTYVNGFYGDTAMSFLIGDTASGLVKKLHQTTRECLYAAIKQCIVGNRIGDVSSAIQAHAEKHGFSVVRDFVGHGVGRHLHEDPQVPNYGEPNTGIKLKPGMVFAIEPMLNIGDYRVMVEDDGWAVRTVDRSMSCHFEHTIAITQDGPEILTLRDNEEYV